MTEKQTRQINALRETGAGYKKIAELTGLSRDTIRNFLKKNSNNKPSEYIEKKGKCKYCGCEICSIPHKREKIFCSNKCRMSWWKEHRELINHKRAEKKICAFCKEQFITERSRKYCSWKCYALSRRKIVAL